MIKNLPLTELQTVAMAVFFASSVMSSVVWFWMQWSVNARLPKEDQIPYFYFRNRWERFLSIMRLYRQMFPQGALLSAYWIFGGLAILAWFTLVVGSMDRRV